MQTIFKVLLIDLFVSKTEKLKIHGIALNKTESLLRLKNNNPQFYLRLKNDDTESVLCLKRMIPTKKP